MKKNKTDAKPQDTSCLDAILAPKAIAVIGASEVAGKAGERRTRSIIESGFCGGIYPINPKRETIFSRQAYRSVLDVDAELDLALIAVPPNHILNTLQQCCEKEVTSVIIVSAGSPDGTDADQYREQLLNCIANTKTRIIGPNCSGVYSSSSSLNCLGIPHLTKGIYSVISQSGNVIDSLIHYAQRANCGFSKIVGAGNAIDLQIHDYLSYLAEDEHTKAILCYIESLRDGRAFLQAARNATRKKPVIAIKVGATSAGQRAAASHTAALAADSAIVATAMKQAGVIQVSNVDELFDIARFITESPIPKGNRVAILSEGGGDNAMAADNAESLTLEVPVFSETLQSRLQTKVLSGMSVSNPVDYGGVAEENPEVIAECVEFCLASNEVDSIYLTGFFGGFKDFIAEEVEEKEIATAKRLSELGKKYQKPIVLHSSFAHSDAKSLEFLKNSGFLVVESSLRAAKGISSAVAFSKSQARIKNGPQSSTKAETTRSAIARCGFPKRVAGNLLETESRQILEEYEVPILKAELAQSLEEAVIAADRLGYPLAMKIVSEDIIHKSDCGGIELNLQNADAVKVAYQRVLKNTEKHTKNIAGVILSPMAEKGIECLIGVTRDATFGPVIMFGMGGIFVEILEDVSLRILPIDQLDLEEMIEEVSGSALLRGARGGTPKDIAAVKDLISKIASIAEGNPEIRELDLNPVIVHESGLSVVDSRIILL